MVRPAGIHVYEFFVHIGGFIAQSAAGKEKGMTDLKSMLDPDRVATATRALAGLGHYMSTLQLDAEAFAQTHAVHDGRRTLKLGRHLAGKLNDALDALDSVLPKD